MIQEALIADFDGDGLRDDQEIAGWQVGLWHERTMESAGNYSVVSDPKVNDTDHDGLNDFSEFLNGSDPWKSDTDGDGLPDLEEVTNHGNVTGIEGTPPTIEDLHYQMQPDYAVWNSLWGSDHSKVVVIFTAKDQVGLSRALVRLTQSGSGDQQTKSFTWNRADLNKSEVVAVEFPVTSGDAFLSGADLNITLYDVNENGAWGDWHVDSVGQGIVKAVAAFLSAVAKVIADAVSFLINFIMSAVGALVDGILTPIHNALDQFVRALRDPLVGTAAFLGLPLSRDGSWADAWSEPILRVVRVIQTFVLVLTAVGILVDLFINVATDGLGDMVAGFILTILLAVVLDTVIGSFIPSMIDIGDAIAGMLPGGSSDFENQATARDLLISAVGVVWDAVMMVAKYLADDVWSWSKGFSLALLGLLVSSLGFEFTATQDGQMSIFSFVFAAVGFIVSYYGFATLKKEEARALKVASKMMWAIKTGIAASAFVATLAMLAATVPAAWSCFVTPRNPC